MTDEKLPEGWVWTTLGEVSTKPQYGWTTKAQHADGIVLLLRTTDISSGTIDWDSVPYCTELPENLADYLLKTDDIVISRAGSVGVSYLLKDIPKQTIFASYLIRFHPLKGIEASYIAYYLLTFRLNCIGIATNPLLERIELHKLLCSVKPLLRLTQAN